MGLKDIKKQMLEQIDIEEFCKGARMQSNAQEQNPKSPSDSGKLSNNAKKAKRTVKELYPRAITCSLNDEEMDLIREMADGYNISQRKMIRSVIVSGLQTVYEEYHTQKNKVVKLEEENKTQKNKMNALEEELEMLKKQLKERGYS